MLKCWPSQPGELTTSCYVKMSIISTDRNTLTPNERFCHNVKKLSINCKLRSHLIQPNVSPSCQMFTLHIKRKVHIPLYQQTVITII